MIGGGGDIDSAHDGSHGDGGVTVARAQPASDPAAGASRPVPPLGRPSPYGEPAAVDSLGGIAAPLLAGFSLALIGLVAQAPQSSRWPDLALLLLAGTTVVMLASVQFAFRARRFAVTPAEAAGWHPDFPDDPERQERVYAEIRAHRRAHRVWSQRARLAYNTGVCLLLLGLATTLLPAGRPSALRLSTVVLVLLALVGELTLLACGWLHGNRYRWRLPYRLSLAAWWLASADPLARPEPMAASGSTARSGKETHVPR